MEISEVKRGAEKGKGERRNKGGEAVCVMPRAQLRCFALTRWVLPGTDALVGNAVKGHKDWHIGVELEISEVK